MSKKNVLKNRKIGFIGTGNMATAIIEGLLSSKTVEKSRIYISDKDKTKLSKKKKILKVNTAKDNQDLVERCNIVILSIKPQDIKDVVDEIKDSLVSRQLVISIAAGVTTEYLRKFIPKQVHLVRVMPNIGCLVKESITAISFDKYIDAQSKKIAKAIFNAVGITEEVGEKDMGVVTALSGSGPAYIAYIFKSFIKEAQKQGLSKKKASTLALQMTEASLDLLKDNNMNFNDLIKKVTSKGGTTEAALKVFKKHKLDKVLAQALKAATVRSNELSRN